MNRTKYPRWGLLVFLFVFLAPRAGAFDAYPDKVDLLVVVAHPDDEGTFGGLLPYYASCQGKRVVLVCLTSGEWGNGLPHHSRRGQTPDYSYDDSDYPRFEKIPADDLYPSYYREGELARMLITAGVRYAPVLPRFKDMSGLQPWGKADAAIEIWGGEDKVVGYVAKQIRRFKPDVVVSMAENGFNGNPMHMAASLATVLACKVSGDPLAYPSPSIKHAAWEPKKLYLHAAEDESHARVHTHEWEIACAGRPGNARIHAANANAQHESQEMKRECPASTDFVLIQSSVGQDSIAKNNLFENIE